MDITADLPNILPPNLHLLTPLPLSLPPSSLPQPTHPPPSLPSYPSPPPPPPLPPTLHMATPPLILSIVFPRRETKHRYIMYTMYCFDNCMQCCDSLCVYMHYTSHVAGELISCAYYGGCGGQVWFQYPTTWSEDSWIYARAGQNKLENVCTCIYRSPPPSRWSRVMWTRPYH